MNQQSNGCQMENNLIVTSITTLIIASYSVIIPESVLANKALVNRQITTPFITRSTADYNSLLIELSPGTLPIQDLEITLPPQMDDLVNLIITDDTVKKIAANFQKQNNLVVISFAEPIEPGKSLKLNFTDINLVPIMGEVLLYKLSVKQENLLQRIPVGTARIDIPDAD